jgi:hypothetical protein
MPEITPEMIDAGVSRLDREGINVLDPRQLVHQLYREMRELEEPIGFRPFRPTTKRDGGIRQPKCQFCKTRAADLECDWKKPRKKSGTCDARMCSECGLNVGPNKDLCPDHQPAYREWLASRTQDRQAPGAP